MDDNQFAALLGFAFVAAWIAFSFGSALLCVIGAGVFYAGAAVAKGELDLGEAQDRLGNRGRSSTRAPRVR